MAGRRRLALDDLDPTQGEDEDARMSDAAPESNDAVSDKQDEKSSSSAETPPPKKTPAKGKAVAAKRPPATPAMKGEEPSDEEAPQAATKPPNKRKSTKPVKNAGEKRQEVEEEEQEQEEEKKKPQAKKARSETDKDTKKKKQKTDDDTPKKTKRRSFVYHPKKNADGTKVKPRDRSMSEIRFYQNSTELLIQSRPVERVVREICQKIVDQRPDLAELLKGGNFRFTEVAIVTLRTAGEQFITDLMEFANMNTSHRARQTLLPQDLHLALWYIQQLKPFANASGTV